MPKIKAVVFDFDGVLTKGGEELKEQAWDFLADPWSDQAKKWLAEARRKFGQGKGSRFVILDYVICQFGHALTFDEAVVPAYAECYDRLVQKLLMDSGLAEGARYALADLEQDYDLFVNSATPVSGLVESLETFQIERFFKLILGQPSSKHANLRIVGATLTVPGPQKIVFVGDGEGDWKAAKKFGCHFIGVVNSWNGWEKDRPKGMPKSCLITSLRELPGKIALLEKK